MATEDQQAASRLGHLRRSFADNRVELSISVASLLLAILVFTGIGWVIDDVTLTLRAVAAGATWATTLVLSALLGAHWNRQQRAKSGDPGLRGLAGWPLLLVLSVTLYLGGVVVGGTYALIGGLVEVTDEPVTPAQRITAAFAVVAALGALVALAMNLRRQDLAEQTAQQEITAAFTERFRSAAAQLGGSSPAERIAGVYAMAALADEYPTRRQQCVDVLCGYLRLPFDPATDHLADRSTAETRVDSDGRSVTTHENPATRPFDLQVRQTITTVIREHTRPSAQPTWSDLDYDLTGAHLTDLDLSGSVLSGRTAFSRATFSGEHTLFSGATFSGDTWFTGATFSGKSTSFYAATFSGDYTSFERATFSSDNTAFHEATFSGKDTSFEWATFSGKYTSFHAATFSGEETSFSPVTFSGETISFHAATFSSETTSFSGATFPGKYTSFEWATFSGEDTSFSGATFLGRNTSFYAATFSGEDTSFSGATFSGKYTSFDCATFTGRTTLKALEWKATAPLPPLAPWTGPETIFERVNVTFDKAKFEEGAEVDGLDEAVLLDGATITRDGEPFRGWPPVNDR